MIPENESVIVGWSGSGCPFDEVFNGFGIACVGIQTEVEGGDNGFTIETLEAACDGGDIVIGANDADSGATPRITSSSGIGGFVACAGALIPEDGKIDAIGELADRKFHAVDAIFGVLIEIASGHVNEECPVIFLFLGSGGGSGLLGEVGEELVAVGGGCIFADDADEVIACGEVGIFEGDGFVVGGPGGGFKEGGGGAASFVEF